MTEAHSPDQSNSYPSQRLRELTDEPIGKLLLKYSLPAVVGTLVSAIYNIIDSIVIGQAIPDPNVVSGIAVTFPVMNIATALGMLIGVGSATRISIVMGQDDKQMAEKILGNSVQLTLFIGMLYMAAFAIFLDPILRLFGASDNSLPYAHEFLMWVLPGMVLMNLTFSYNNVMRATGYPGRAMWTNLLGAGLNSLLAPLMLFVFGMGIRGAAIATDISMTVTAVFVMWHFFQKKSTLHFKKGTFRLNGRIIWSIIYIGLSPFLINVAGSAVNAIVNNSLLKYGGDNAVAAVVVFNRFATIFVFVVIGICQGMQPILGYNYGSKRYDRLFRTFWYAAGAATAFTVSGCITAHLWPHQIASLFMQEEEQIQVAMNCLRIATISFWIVGFQIVATNFFQSLGMPGKSVFLSLTRQILFMVPMLLILPPFIGLDGVWATYPVCDILSAIVAGVMLWHQIRLIKKKAGQRPA